MHINSYNFNKLKNIYFLCILFTGLFLYSQQAPAEESEMIESIIEYLEFAQYQGGNILPEQIPEADWKNFHVIDARRAEDYATDHIPGAVHIEWRSLIDQRNKIPRDKAVIVYCNTGSLSAQGAFALKLVGYDNVKILTGGYDGFKAKGGLQANERARNPRL
jgi:rhodanese-related sulfurtransferase